MHFYTPVYAHPFPSVYMNVCTCVYTHACKYVHRLVHTQAKEDEESQKKDAKVNAIQPKIACAFFCPKILRAAFIRRI